MANNFPFTIRQVAKILNLEVRYENPNSGNMDTDCPFCKKESKLNINVVKNVYRCNSCNDNGGMVALYAKVHEISNKEAYSEICELLGCSKTSDLCDMQTTPQKTSRASIDTIHQTYSMMLSMLTLERPHKEHLLMRGLSDGQISEFNYKSVPAFGQANICERLLQIGCTLEGVPGFFKDNDKWNVALKAPGVLMPISSIDGRITGIQIRLNRPVNGRKYIWLSSNGLEGGVTSGSPIHFIGDPTAKRIYVTDGSLKGTVAHILTNHTFVCLPGAKILDGLDNLLVRLKANGTTEFLEAFNINKLTDQRANESAANLRKKLSGFGFKVTSAVWNDKSLAGVDDYFLHRKIAGANHVYSVDISAPAMT